MQPKLNTGVNAIIVINSAEYLPVSYFVERNARFKEKSLKLGRELTVHEGFEIACNLIQEPKERKKVLSMIVVENPHAAVPLSRELFRGPFDQRHAYEGNILKPVYYGAEQKVYDELEEEVKKYY